MKKNRHFTLIELLIVIAIIAILAALLLPALQRARDMAKKTSCRNNMKTAGIAIRMYADDFNNYIIPCHSGSSYGPYSYLLWMQLLGTFRIGYPEMKGGVAAMTRFMCPVVEPPYNSTNAKAYSWGFNLNLTTFNTWSAAKKMGAIRNASAALCLAETIDGNGIFENAWNLQIYPPVQIYQARFHFRHTGILNGIFYDGHVSDMKIMDIPVRQDDSPFWYGK